MLNNYITKECKYYLEHHIKEGDFVKVIRPGKTYTQYIDWVNDHVKTEKRNNFNQGIVPDLHEKGKVICIGEHDKGFNTLVYIESLCTGLCYLVGIEGVRKIKGDQKSGW